VGLNYLHFDSKALTIAIALFVATIKATLVACYFMHLDLGEEDDLHHPGFTDVFRHGPDGR
jgi:caa(3)-type oxidase subunit IV